MNTGAPDDGAAPAFPTRRRGVDDDQVDAMRYACTPLLTPWGYRAPAGITLPTIPPAFHAALRERLIAAFSADAPTVVLPPATFEIMHDLERTFRENLRAVGRFLDVLYRSIEPALREFAKIVKRLHRLEYECREERRQHRRNPPRTTLMHRTYRARRRGRW